MKKYFYPILFTLFLSSAALSSGCDSGNEGGPVKSSTQPASTTSTSGAITSPDKTIEVILPAGWREGERPAGVQLGLENPSKDLHVFIYTVTKPKDMSFTQYSETARDNLKNYLTSGQVAATSNTTVSGSPAIQYEILGTSGNNDLQYLLTIVDNPKNFYQIAAWALRPKFEPNRNELQQILKNLKIVAG